MHKKFFLRTVLLTTALSACLMTAETYGACQSGKPIQKASSVCSENNRILIENIEKNLNEVEKKVAPIRRKAIQAKIQELQSFKKRIETVFTTHTLTPQEHFNKLSKIHDDLLTFQKNLPKE